MPWAVFYPDMKRSRFLALASSFVFVAGVHAAESRPVQPAAEGAANAPAAAKPAAGKAQIVAELKPGMAADEIVKRMGRPQSVTPMNAPTGKAEVWIYREPIGESSAPVLIGSKPVTMVVRGTDGKDVVTTVAEEPVYKMQRRVTVQVVALLMFNDHFLQQKTTEQEERSF